MESVFKKGAYWLLNVGLFLLLITPVIIVTYLSYSRIQQKLTDEVYSNRVATAKLMATAVESRLDSAKEIGEVAAVNIGPLAEKEQWNNAITHLRAISVAFPHADRVFLTDKKGVLKGIYPESPENLGKDFSFRDWYKGVSRNWQPYASEVFKRAPKPQYNTVAVAVPVKDSKGNPIGVLGLAMSLESFYDLTKNFNIGQSGFLYIVNQKGQIVAHPKFPALGPIVDFSSVTIVKKILNKESAVGIFYNEVEKVNRVAAAEIVDNYNWGVVVTEPVDAAFLSREETLQSLRREYGIIIIISGLTALVILYIIKRLRKQSQELRIEDERFKLISKATNDVVYDWNLITNNLWFSDGMQKLFGYSKTQVVETIEWWSSLIHPDDRNRIDAQVEQMLKGSNDSFTLDYRFQRADKSWAEVQDRAFLVRDSSGKPIRYLGVIQDVTEQKKYQHNLEVVNEKLKNVDKLKDEFVSVASHELRTPMTAIKGFTSMILDGDYGAVNEPLKQPLQDVAASTDRLIHLVNDMLNVSRIEAGRLKFDLSEFSVDAVIHEVVETLTPIAKQKNITLNAVELKPVAVQADSDKVKQVLNNIIGNALKFVDAGSIEVSMKEVETMVHVYIKDTGVGISKEDQAKLFAKFQQISSQQVGKPAGTGLGLYISKELIEKMGGTMWIESSEIGKGSVFAFSIPKAKSPEAEKAKAAIESEAAKHPDQKS